MFQVIESTKSDGTLAHRFVEGDSTTAVNFAVEQARRFGRKPGIVSTRVYEATAEEVAALRAARCAS